MADDAVHDPEESLELQKTAAGLKIRATGQRTPTVLAAAAAGAIILFLGYRHHDAMAANHIEVQKNHHELKAALDELTYVLALPQEKRERLEIAMPDTLRSKQRRRRDSE